MPLDETPTSSSSTTSDQNTIDFNRLVRLRDLTFSPFTFNINSDVYPITENNYIEMFDTIFSRSNIYFFNSNHLLNKNMFVILKYFVVKNGIKADWVLDLDLLAENFNQIVDSTTTFLVKLNQLYYEYKYFGMNPSLFKDADREEFVFKYFLWVKKSEDPENLEVSVDNFEKYTDNRYSFMTWTERQMKSFINVNLLDGITKHYDIKLNKESVLTLLAKNFMLSELIKFYFLGDLIEFMDNEMEDNQFNTFLHDIETKYQKIQKSIDTKLRNISNKTSNTRFKWQGLCKPSSFNVFKQEELNQLASDERIPFANTMTKRELCGEFAKRFENVIKGKEKVENKCINTTSILLTDIKDIPPEFFYTYTHNNKVYCDDIRELYQHFSINGNKNPIDRTVVSQSIVEDVKKQYVYLTNTTLSLNDFDGLSPTPSNSSTLTQKATNFTVLLNYPNSTQLYINCTNEKLNEFMNTLKDENILSDSEIRGLSVLNLEQKKITLADTLTIKIKTELNSSSNNQLSAIAINTSNVYNEVFI